MEKTGMEHIFNDKVHCNLKVENSLFVNHCRELITLINAKPKLRFYKSFKFSIDTENYVKYNLSNGERFILVQLRMGILPLAIETGHFNNKAVDQRKCLMCNQNAIEDEHHFIFNCDLYTSEIDIFFKTVTEKCPDFMYHA